MLHNQQEVIMQMNLFHAIGPKIIEFYVRFL